MLIKHWCLVEEVADHSWLEAFKNKIDKYLKAKIYFSCLRAVGVLDDHNPPPQSNLTRVLKCSRGISYIFLAKIQKQFSNGPSFTYVFNLHAFIFIQLNTNFAAYACCKSIDAWKLRKQFSSRTFISPLWCRHFRKEAG